MTFILVSLKKEIEYFLDILKNVKKGKVSKYTIYSGRIHEKEVTVIKTGIGRKPLDLDMFNDCSRIISAGFCGALVPNLKSGDIVVSTEVMLAETGFLDRLFKGAGWPASFSGQPKSFKEQPAPSVDQAASSGEVPETSGERIMSFDEIGLLKNPAAESLYGSLSGSFQSADVNKISGQFQGTGFNKISGPFQNDDFKIHAGRTVTASRAIRNYKEKVCLGRAAGAVSVDMEDYYRMETAKRLGVPCVSVRAVLDEVHDDIPGFRSGLHFHSAITTLLGRFQPAKMNIAFVLEKVCQ